MRLTLEEFKRIRPLRWSLRSFGDKVYNTTINQTDTQLFWLDFMRLVFAPKFKKQYGVTNIASFDQTQPVLLSDDLELRLPTQLETAMYFANNDSVPMKFAFNISQMTIAIVAVLIIVLLIICNILFEKRLNSRNII